MTISNQVVVTTIGELSVIIQNAHLQFGDNHNKQINLVIDERGQVEIETPEPFTTNSESDRPFSDDIFHGDIIN